MKKNQKLYLMLVPAVIIMIAVIVSQVINVKNAFSSDEAKPSENDISIKFELNPEVKKIEEQEDDLNQKVENYREGERKLKETESTEISFSSVFKNREKKSVPDPVEEPNPTYTDEQQIQKASRPVSKASIPSRPSNRKVQTKRESETETPISKDNREPVSSMGVYVAPSAQGDNGSNGSSVNIPKSIIQEYMDAVLEEDKTIEHGGNVIFILSKATTIAGITHKPGSTLYGRASLMGDMFDILVYQIKSTDGKMYTCTLTTYDENYNPGIRTGGEVNKAARENVDDAAIEQMDVSTTTGLLNTAIKAAAKTASQAKNRKVTVSLRKGYKVHLKERDKQ
ncbi:MAG: conjugative transposon protein TraM [Tannerella sp.]|jgi:hypothetical protein|nr:conjugative transposon protein TraM [Tannerella sp.]